MPEGFDRYRWPLVGALFALCIAPTFVSYQPYLFSWDDSDYLMQSMQVSRALWSGSVHGLGAMASIRPPMMALLGWPWGRLTSWAAAGDCFLSLAVLTAFLVAFCLYLLLRIGVKPLALLAASVCLFASLGPYPHPTMSFIDLNTTAMAAAAHWASTAFLADNFFAWITLAALLLIPRAARTSSLSFKGGILEGVLWGFVLSLGVMTKLDFFYFVLLILPILLFITLRRSGSRALFAALTGFIVSSAPSAFYLARWGGPAFKDAKASSFGAVSNYYFIPLFQFLTACIRDSPGLLFSFMLVVAGLIYLLIKRRITLQSPDFLALAITIGFGAIVLAAANRQIRYAFPVIVALPFLTAVLLSGKGDSVPRRSAASAALLVFCIFVAAGVPMRHRAKRQSISRPEAVLAKAAARHAHRVLLATDSPTLNWALMQLAVQMSRSGASTEIETLANPTMETAPIQEDFQEISNADQVVFQDQDKLSPPFTNLRVPEYEYYVRQLGYLPIKVGKDITVYSRRCSDNENTRAC